MSGVIFLVLAAAQFAQTSTGELRLNVSDPDGLSLQSSVMLVSEANQVAQHLDTDAKGTLVVRRLPFGRYELDVTRSGFATFTTMLDIRSALPTDYHVTLTLAAVQESVEVTAEQTLLDTHQSSTVSRLGAEMLQNRIASLPGRSVSDLVNTQAGWLLEANGIIHPRGSEYQVQYVTDGLPITDNRSAAFAPELDIDDVHSMNIMTAGYPAEYGRKLGGVIEVVTAGAAQKGFHGNAKASVARFGTRAGGTMVQYGTDRSTVALSGSASRTDRYLDPPVEENFSNSGTGSNVAVHLEREMSDRDRLGVIMRHGQTRFLVPNERVQEDAGQRQQRTSAETTGQLSYQHIFSASLLGDLRGMARTLTAGLSANALSTPIIAQQDRGVREGYVKGTITAHRGVHELEAGGDADFGTIREALGYQITDPDQFDPDTPQIFAFADRHADREQALFVQDQMRLGPWTVNAGLRWDHYQLVVDQSAFSPRLGVAWSWPAADLVVRASYDRAFQTPALENLLLASSPSVDSLSESVVRLPVRPSLGNFYEIGASKRVGRFRIDVTHFNRHMTNFADDDLLFNTGVSFPIAFTRAEIQGTEIKLELPRWRSLSGYFSYGNMVGHGYLPITGGFLLGDETASALITTTRFPVSQDQRHTIRSRVNWQLSERAWLALASSYGSGLPVEFNGNPEQALAQHDQRIVDRVDLANGRVRPNLSFDASASLVVLKMKKQRVRIQADLVNLTNRVNLINFAGLFSGTSLASPRNGAARVQVEF